MVDLQKMITELEQRKTAAKKAQTEYEKFEKYLERLDKEFALIPKKEHGPVVSDRVSRLLREGDRIKNKMDVHREIILGFTLPDELELEELKEQIKEEKELFLANAPLKDLFFHAQELKDTSQYPKYYEVSRIFDARLAESLTPDSNNREGWMDYMLSEHDRLTGLKSAKDELHKQLFDDNRSKIDMVTKRMNCAIDNFDNNKEYQEVIDNARKALDHLLGIKREYDSICLEYTPFEERLAKEIKEKIDKMYEDKTEPPKVQGYNQNELKIIGSLKELGDWKYFLLCDCQVSSQLQKNREIEANAQLA